MKLRLLFIALGTILAFFAGVGVFAVTQMEMVRRGADSIGTGDSWLPALAGIVTLLLGLALLPRAWTQWRTPAPETGGISGRPGLGAAAVLCFGLGAVAGITGLCLPTSVPGPHGAWLRSGLLLESRFAWLAGGALALVMGAIFTVGAVWKSPAQTGPGVRKSYGVLFIAIVLLLAGASVRQPVRQYLAYCELREVMHDAEVFRGVRDLIENVVIAPPQSPGERQLKRQQLIALMTQLEPGKAYPARADDRQLLETCQQILTRGVTALSTDPADDKAAAAAGAELEAVKQQIWARITAAGGYPEFRDELPDR